MRYENNEADVPWYILAVMAVVMLSILWPVTVLVLGWQP